MNRKMEENVGLWNNFCDEDSKLQDEIKDLLKTEVSREEIKTAISRIVAKKQKILDNFAEKILQDGNPEEAIWYLERSTKLIRLFQDFIKRKFNVRCPEIKPPWVKAVNILYEKVLQAGKVGEKIELARLVPEPEVGKVDTMQTTEKVFAILQESKVVEGKYINKNVWRRIVNKSRPIIRYERSLCWSTLAKSIADNMGCEILIQPIKLDFGVESRTLTVEEHELKGQLVKGPKVKMRRHFIFYKPCGDAESDMFRITHELGHCALHFPLGPTRQEFRYKSSITEVDANVYDVNFSEREEAEADAFAFLVLMGSQGKWFGWYEEPQLKDFIVRMWDDCVKKNLLRRF